MIRDIKLGWRALRRSPGYAVVSILTLALGVGANLALFTVLYNTVLRPLPYREPDRLVQPALKVWDQRRGWRFIGFSYPKYLEIRQAMTALEDSAAYGMLVLPWARTPEGDRERINVELVTEQFFPLLGIQPQLGRTFLPGEETVALISHELWRSRFGTDPAVAGTWISVGGARMRVVGVLPAWFHGEYRDSQIWVPMSAGPGLDASPTMLRNRGQHWHEIVARLKPGFTIEQAQAQAESYLQQMKSQEPAPGNWGIAVRPLKEAKTDVQLRSTMLVLYGAVALLLGIACLNLAGLALARAIDRKHEVRVRLSLGASRAGVVRLLLAEAAMVGTAGGGLAVLLGSWTLQGLAAMAPAEAAGTSTWDLVRRGFDARSWQSTPWLMAAAVGVSILVSLLFSIPAAWRAAGEGLSESQRGAGARVAAWRSRRLLLVGQIALSLCLVAGAMVMLESLGNTLRASLGIDSARWLSFRMDLPAQRYTREAATVAQREFLRRLREMPGVEAVTTSDSAPASGSTSVTGVGLAPGVENKPLPVNHVGEGFFGQLRIPVLEGRSFQETDRPGGPLKVVLSRAAARYLFGEGPVVGKPLWWSRQAAEVIGVVEDVRYSIPDPPLPGMLYICQCQASRMYTTYLVRAQSEAAAMLSSVRAEAHRLDPQLIVYRAATIPDLVNRMASTPRFITVLLTGFAGLALMIAMIGVYGVFAHSVAARRAETGVRLAVGAHPLDILTLVLRQGGSVAATGIAGGLLLAVAGLRWLAPHLYHVAPLDPAALTWTSVVMLAAVAAACWVPARRASRVDAVEALRDL